MRESSYSKLSPAPLLPRPSTRINGGDCSAVGERSSLIFSDVGDLLASSAGLGGERNTGDSEGLGFFASACRSSVEPPWTSWWDGEAPWRPRNGDESSTLDPELTLKHVISMQNAIRLLGGPWT